MVHFFRLLWAALVALGLFISPSLAHPHILIDAKAVLVFDAEGRLAAIRNTWTFDEAFSVWQTQGLDTNGDHVVSSDEMQELADENMTGLAEYGFYISAGAGKETLKFKAAGDQKFTFDNNRSTLSFTAELNTPYVVRGPLDIAIADPEYYVAITLTGADVTLENAPAGCGIEMVPGHDMPDDIAARLFDLPPDVTQLPPDLEQAVRGVQGAIRLTCEGAAAAAPPPATALDAVTSVAEAKPSKPFGGPPPEPGFNLPSTGFLGWVRSMQEGFYRDLSTTLDRLKHDGSAFWVLGTLSFLYGVFHAAGPGHGKVVIGSYMLANERQLRRGVLLSVLAAMLQSATAVVFVGVAAAILGLSAVAMSEAVGWLDIASYGLIALLGLWLVARRVFGWGHHHHHEPVDLAAKAHAHLSLTPHALRAQGSGFTFQPPRTATAPAGPDAHGRLPGHPHYGHDHGDETHDHGHHHVVTADQLRGDWREQLGVVVSVGIRPCSGALLVLFFAMSQGLLAAGIASVFLMGVGTAITVSVLAAIAVTAKGAAQRLLGVESGVLGRILWWVELVAGVIVFLFGLVWLLASLGIG